MKLKELLGKYKEVIMYLIFGVATTVVSWALYILFVEFLNLEMTLSNALSWIGAVTFAFFTNRSFVFESKEKTFLGLLKEMILFVGSRALSGVVEIFLPTFLVFIGLNGELLGIEGFWAKAATSVIVIFLNYIFSKWIVFKKAS